MTNQKFFHPAKWSSSGLFFFYSGDDLLSVEFFTTLAFRGTILPRVWESLGSNSTRSTLNFKINIFCFSARRAVSSSKRKSGRLIIIITWVTCLPIDDHLVN